MVQASGQWPSWYDYAIHRKEWPGFGTRYCTKQWKSQPIDKLITGLKKLYQKTTGRKQIRVLLVMGMRADESADRGRRYGVYQHEVSRSSGERWVDLWLPLYHWTAKQVWAHIHKRGLEYHPVYDLGMERLSCAFCPLAGRHELVEAARIAYQIDPALLDRVVSVERAIGKPIKASRVSPLWMRDVRKALKEGRTIEEPPIDESDQGEWCFPFADEED